jgi:hypothetical protein
MASVTSRVKVVATITNTGNDTLNHLLNDPGRLLTDIPSRRYQESHRYQADIH